MQIITPNWLVSKRVNSLTTTRNGGVSSSPFDSFNLATHVEDSLEKVLENRQHLVETLDLQSSPFWLNQQHTTRMVKASDFSVGDVPVADAAWTDESNQPIVVMTADCLPILVTNKAETFVAAIHAGWKGLLDGIVSQSLRQLPDEPENLKVWIGPAISQKNFEVGKEVLTQFTEHYCLLANSVAYFKPIKLDNLSGKYWADLPGLVEAELKLFGVNLVTQSGLCSFDDEARFYSYRREGKTGRMASLIWLAD